MKTKTSTNAKFEERVVDFAGDLQERNYKLEEIIVKLKTAILNTHNAIGIAHDVSHEILKECGLEHYKKNPRKQ
jgi:hypothetical protein